MVRMSLKCNRHPKYRALRKPKSCRACTMIWDMQHPGANAKTWPAKVGDTIYTGLADNSILITRRLSS